MSDFGAGQCPYLATSCPLLKPYAASFQTNGEDGANDGRPSPSACASAHSSPALVDPNQPQHQQQQQPFDPYSVPIHNLHPSSGYDNQGAYRQQLKQQQQDQQRNTVSPTLDTHAAFPPSSYSRPPLASNDSTTTSSSTLSPSSSQPIHTHRRQPSANSPPTDFGIGASNTSPYSTSPLINSNEPPTPNSFLRSPPVSQQQAIPNLQQPVFPHHHQQQQAESSSSHALQGGQQQQYTPSDSSYADYTSSANYLDGRGGGSYSTSAAGAYGTYNTEDIEDLSFNRQPQPAPQTFQPMLLPEHEERKVFASLEEVHDDGQHPKKEEVGEQTAFISKLWHLLSHPEYTRYLKWSKDGQAFILTNSNEFAIKVLPRFFRHSNVASFVRQLNLYSFQRVSTIRLLDMADSSTSTSINPYAPNSHSHSHHPFGPDSDSEDHHSSHSGGSPGPSAANGGAPDTTVAASGFTHPHFQRDHPELLKLLKPRGSTRKQGSSSVAAKKAAAAVREEAERRGGGVKGSSGGGGKAGSKK